MPDWHEWLGLSTEIPMRITWLDRSDVNVTWWRHQMETFWRYWPFVRGIHRSPVNSPHNGQCRGALMSSLICAWINGWLNNGEAGGLRCHRTHYDVTVMLRCVCNRWIRPTCQWVIQMQLIPATKWLRLSDATETVYGFILAFLT